MIFVGVPVWRGAAFVAETLESILAQEGVPLSVFIAIDGDDTGSFEACQPFLMDDRVRLVRHPRRLGWVGNIGFLFDEGLRAGTEYVCVQPHDDLMLPGYLAALHDQAQKAPGAAVVYSDIGVIGRTTMFRIPSVRGTPFERQMTMLTQHYSAAAIRGLTRTAVLGLVPSIGGNAVGDFAVDTVWCARMATVGDLLHVPRTLYLKRYHAQNTHGKWSTWGRDRKIAAWKQHCLDMLAEALAVAANAREAEQLVGAARSRLLHGVEGGPYRQELASIDPPARRALEHQFTIESLVLVRAARKRHDMISIQGAGLK